jgi:galactokinase/mevalonate kinase-like predicted kinase
MTENINTKRDLVWSVLIGMDEDRWTVSKMKSRLDVEVSNQVIREVFKSAVENGLMNHKKNTQFYFRDF